MISILFLEKNSSIDQLCKQHTKANNTKREMRSQTMCQFVCVIKGNLSQKWDAKWLEERNFRSWHTSSIKFSKWCTKTFEYLKSLCVYMTNLDMENNFIKQWNNNIDHQRLRNSPRKEIIRRDCNKCIRFRNEQTNILCFWLSYCNMENE